MKKTRVIKINTFFIIIVVFLFLCIIFKLLYISLGNVKVNGKTLTEFASSRDTTRKTLKASRGTIYSSSGDVLAKDVNSYTVIAYLDSSRTKDENNPHHVVDKEYTAKTLAPLLNMTEKQILELLNTKVTSCTEDGNQCTSKSPYQVELGPGGRGITELLKDKIDNLDLPGIDFISTSKRYYPNGDFLSYTLGYARVNDDGEYKGEMGIELYYNKELTGKDGYMEYQSDVQGYQITNSPTVLEEPVSGNDIYLTIDNNIQMFAEEALTTLEKGKPTWASVVVADAKTGAILGVASSPSFNNNTLNIKSYYDPFVSYSYEPGSTMKIFSFLAAMENGIYDGDEKYKSGSIKVDDAIIKDWNGRGWGNVTYDFGFMASSNVAASNLALKLGRAKLKDFYNDLGFGKKTGISLPNETSGIINFKYNTEIASASYGQGITVSEVQMIQALTTIANEGTVLKPYIVSKIVNSETGEVTLENKRTEVKKVASKENVDKIIELMRGVVTGASPYSTGTSYKVKGYDLIGKTGTAQIASSSGGYQKNNYIRSFAGIFPGNDPQVIVYVAALKLSSSSYLPKAVKSVVKDVGTYLNIKNVEVSNTTSTYTLNNYINSNVETVSEELTKNKLTPVVIGEGEKVLSQYPSKNTVVNSGSKVFLLTSSSNIKMPDIKGWSRGDVETFCNLINLKVSFDGYGYVTKYSIKKDTIIDSNDTLEVVLEDKYNIKEES